MQNIFSELLRMHEVIRSCRKQHLNKAERPTVSVVWMQTIETRVKQKGTEYVLP